MNKFNFFVFCFIIASVNLLQSALASSSEASTQVNVPKIICFAGEDKEGGQFIPMKHFPAGMIGEGFYLDLPLANGNLLRFNVNQNIDQVMFSVFNNDVPFAFTGYQTVRTKTNSLNKAFIRVLGKEAAFIAYCELE